MVQSEKWYRQQVSKIADIIQEIQKDSKVITIDRILTDVSTWESEKLRE